MTHITKFLAMVALTCSAPAQATAAVNELTEAERRAGWQLVFDGKSTDGWRNYQKESVSDGWQVEDGILRRPAKGKKRAGDIITDKQYQNFELSIEYKISPGGNSGIMFHVTEEEKKPWQTGPEIQIQDNIKGHDPQLSGWLYQLYRPVAPNWVKRAESQVGIKTADIVDATRPAGEWNHLYLRIAPGNCEVCMNGVSYFRFNKGDRKWDNLVSKSKFAAFEKFGKATKGHICLQDHGNEVAFRNIKIRELSDSGGVPKDPIDGTLDVEPVIAFPKITWEDWEPVDERGRSTPLRPIVMTHANDGSNRLFVATQNGMIHVFPNDPEVTETKMFLDLRDRVAHWRKGNEEGLLGFALHPNYTDNGEVYVYYTSKTKARTSIVSRFKRSQTGKADPASEEVLMEIAQPFSNHNGGSILFGKDGYLYIGLGDGGSRNDPMANGQNLSTLMGSILRIDVNKKSGDRAYAIPADNPFLDVKDAQPEIYAYGFRNIWRLAMDRETGDIWAADVGQDLWEEINIVQKGGNYGWSIKEANLNFTNRTAKSPAAPTQPVWEYDHQIGKSITGGYVYRGKQVPALSGMYLYSDYVTGKIWALKHDSKLGKVTRNMAIPSDKMPVLAFGEDEQGEVLYGIAAVNGRGIYKFKQK